MGLFNRRIKDDNRKAIAQGLADFLGVEIPVPDSFEGIPVLNPQKSWFFGHAQKREPDDIDELWDVFEYALYFAKSGENSVVRSSFVQSYNRALQIRQVAHRKLTMGFYWTRPQSFQTLDNNSEVYVTKKLKIPLAKNVDGEEYLALLDALRRRFQEDGCPIHSYQELSLAAVSEDRSPPPDDQDVPIPGASYSSEAIVNEGCFLDGAKIAAILERLRVKKNLILQGPPGTGKTWLARRLAFALIGQKDDSKVRAFQFHPNLSYEDFVRGFRPSENGELKLVDGPLIEMIEAAMSHPEDDYVMVVEEINRGNPAQIFGEMLTLLEADKREPSEALALTYRKNTEERVYIPENLYLIGTMNLADRSLAMVDFALRRRFAFVTLEPILGATWSNWVHENCGIEREALTSIAERIGALNTTLSEDANLGPQFQIGHSFVTPHEGSLIQDVKTWYRHVVETEIGPLLDEYWFDDRQKAESEQEQLLAEF